MKLLNKIRGFARTKLIKILANEYQRELENITRTCTSLDFILLLMIEEKLDKRLLVNKILQEIVNICTTSTIKYQYQKDRKYYLQITNSYQFNLHCFIVFQIYHLKLISNLSKRKILLLFQKIGYQKGYKIKVLQCTHR